MKLINKCVFPSKLTTAPAFATLGRAFAGAGQTQRSALGNPNGTAIAVGRSGMRVGLLQQHRRRSTGGRLVLGILVAESAVPA